MSDHRRLAIERLLVDELADRRPPDLRNRIRSALCDRRTRGSPPAPLQDSPPNRRTVRAGVTGMLLGAAVIALLWSLQLWAPGPEADHRVLTGRVLTGVAHLHPALGTAAEPWRPRLAFQWTPSVGDRLDTQDRTTRVQLDGFGLLVCAPHTSLEVMDVNWKPFTGGFAAGSITITALAGAATWFGDGEHIDTPDESMVLAAGTGDREIPPIAGAIPDRELLEARKRIAELEAALSRREAPAPEIQNARLEAIDTGAGFAEQLRAVDWLQVGDAITGYLDAKQTIEELIAAGEPVPMELRAAADRWEGLLFEQIGPLLDESVPGSTVTAKAHHPALGANMLQATLAAAGLELDPTQRRWVEDIGRRYTLEDAQRRASYNDETLELERFVDEIDMQDRFFQDQRRVLSDAQQERLSFGELAERTGVDPFGAGYQWNRNKTAITADSREGIAARVTRGFHKDLQLSERQQAQLAPIVQRWASRLPQRWLDLPMDDLDRTGRMHIERVRSAAHLQVELMRELAQGLGLSAEQLRLLRGMNRVYVPFLQR